MTLYWNQATKRICSISLATDEILRVVTIVWFERERQGVQIAIKWNVLETKEQIYFRQK